MSLVRRGIYVFVICLLASVLAKSQTVVALVPGSATQGQPFSVVVSVTIAGTPVKVGTVDFLDGSQLLKTVQVPGVTNAWATAGTATLHALLPAGAHTLKAIYHGPYPAAPVSSAPVALNVSGTRTTDAGLHYAGTSDLSQNHAWDFIPDFTLADTTLDGFADVLALHFDTSQLVSAAADPTNPGLFSAPAFYPASYLEAGQVLAADLHADGLLDAVVSIVDTGQVLLYRAQSPNSFAAPVTMYVSGIQYPKIGIADFDGDGLPDIAAVGFDASGGASLNIFLNDPANPGTFQRPLFIALANIQPFDFAVADLNGDGLPDVVVGGATTAGNISQVAVGLNKPATPGRGFTSTIQDLGTTFFQLTVGDLNHDGYPDLIAGGLNGNLLVSLNDALHPGTLLAPSAIAPPAAMRGIALAGLAVGDIDGDGMADIAAADTGSFFTVFHGNGDGTFVAGGAITTSPTTLQHDDPVFAWENTAVRIADLDGDGYGDVVLSEIRQNTVQTYLHRAGVSTPLIQTSSDISSTSNVFHQGQTIPLTSLETSTSGTMTGLVTFYDSGGGAAFSSIGTAPIVNGKIATFQVAGAAVGFHDFTAVFPGDATFAPSQSAILAIVVVAGPFAAVNLSATPASTLQGQTVTLSATVSSTSGTPTGNVVFMDGGVPIGTAVAISGGVALLTTSTLASGVHNLTAVYSGDATFPPATSNVVVETILGLATSNLSVTPASGTTITTFRFTSTVTGSGSRFPSGTVTLYSGGAAVGSAALDGTGSAAFNLANLLPGTYSFTAQYAGDSFFPASASNSVSVMVTLQPTSLGLSVNPTSGTTSGVESLTATVNYPAYSGAAPASPGTISFYDGMTLLATVPVTGMTTTLQQGFAAAGTHTLTASFSGDARFGASISNSVSLQIAVNDFTVTTSPAPLTIRTEHHAPMTVTLQSLGAFSGAVSLSCMNLPQHATCSFDHTTLVLQAGGSASTRVVVDTDDVLYFMASGSALLPTRRDSSRPASGLTAASLLGLFAFGGMAMRRRGRRLPTVLCAALFLCGLPAITGCGDKYPAHTAPGTYTFTIQATAASVQHGNATTLIVTQ